MDNEPLDPQIIPYKAMYIAAVIVAFLYVVVVAITNAAKADPNLGLSPQLVAWAGVIKDILGGVGFLLPSLRKPPSAQRKGMD